MRSDYCPIANEPCQALCQNPCRTAKQATSHETLIKQLLDSRVPKTELEHAAAREIERLSELTKKSVSIEEYKHLQRLVTNQGIRLMEYESEAPEPAAWINFNAATGERNVSFVCESELASIPLWPEPNKITPAVVKQLVEAAESALEAMQSVAGEAYQRAEPVCCGRGGNECCGCPEPKWNSADEVILLRLHRPQQELTAALAAAKEAGL